MKTGHKTILSVLEAYLESHPEVRFGQALFNLNINQFASNSHPESLAYNLRDIYNDKDEEILARMRLEEKQS